MTNKRLYLLLIVLLSTSCTKHPALSNPKTVTEFQVNLNDRDDDLFKVTVRVNGLTKENSYFQFAATAPGTYQTMDIGRYVQSFKAFDKENNEIQCTQNGTNRWDFSDPEKIAIIEYTIAETWDTPVDSNSIYRMCGTSLEADHALINGQAVFGYIAGMQEEEIHLKFFYPQNWLVGTALAQNEAGEYVANNYDHLVDSPVQLGVMTKASTMLDKTEVSVFSYSKTGLIPAEEILSAMEEMLQAAKAFLGNLPVDHYTFLYHFEDASHGAWEHSYSSSYVYQEREFNEFKDRLLKTAAHEFFHIVTPLNIHSEIIEHFNFSEPTPSKHLWLYEGTTEWAAQIMLLKAGISTIDDYFDALKRKITVDRMYDSSYSLTDLAMNSYSGAGARQYGNIYMRGALVSGLLDILLLDLSDGQKGLRELMLELASEYGPSKPFEEEFFFEELAKKTYPEVGEFINNYIIHANPLPIAAYYEKIGVNYFAHKNIEDKELGIEANNGEFYFTEISDALQKHDIRKKDKLIKINGKNITMTSMRRLKQKMKKATDEEPYTLVMERDEEEIVVESSDASFKKFLEDFVGNFQKLNNASYDIFELNPSATSHQIELREQWLKN